MPAFVQKSLLIALLSAWAPSTLASTTGVYLPSAPTGPGGEDSIETSSGTRCRQSINSNGAYLDVGVTGTAGSPDNPAEVQSYHDDRAKEATAYARVTVPLGRRPQRIDCSQIFQLEITKLKREIELLRLGVK